MKPRRLYRQPYSVSRLVLRQSEAWARALPDNVEFAETRIRDARGRRFSVTLFRDFNASGLLSVCDRRCTSSTSRRWWLAPLDSDERDVAIQNPSILRALSAWTTWTSRGNSASIDLESEL